MRTLPGVALRCAKQRRLAQRAVAAHQAQQLRRQQQQCAARWRVLR